MVGRQHGNCNLLVVQAYLQACFVLDIIHVSGAILDIQSFAQARGLTLTGPVLWNDNDVRSVIHCISACTHHSDECYAVGFSTFHKNCSYFQWFLNSVPLRAVVGMDSDRVILVKPTPVLYLTGMSEYSLTFNESVNLCEAVGGRLATYDELKAAWNLGYHNCRCGWLENGSAYFPSHINSNECGNAVQINTCTGSTHYDAYCTTLLM